MNLLVDIGNSRLKWAFEKQGSISTPAVNSCLHDQLVAYCDEHWALLEKPDKVIVSNVAGPNIQARLDQWLNDQWAISSKKFKSKRSAFGVVNGYTEADKLGADRWACLLAVKKYFSLPACIVDCGTAITVDFIDDCGVHKGGLIIPGLKLMEQSLIANTCEIECLGETKYSLLGCDTASGIERGILSAVCGMIEKMFSKLSEDCPGTLHLFLTGGNAARISPDLNLSHKIIPDLVLRGLTVLI